MRCSHCRLPLSSRDERRSPAFSSVFCDACLLGLQGPSREEITADHKARQARRRELKPLLADVLRKHAANRAEIAKKILTFVSFDLPE